jgi:uncharacterized pyridoxamine 5'-phosphate oxidase family protein
MHHEALAYLKNEHIGVLAVQMPDGSPHGATIHFAHTEEPPVFIIMTNPEYRKYQALAHGPVRATMVVGVDEDDMKTLQMDGMVELSDNIEFQEQYYKKFPSAEAAFKKDVLFTFTPTWWRFTDWTRPEGKTIWCSED